MSAFSTSLTTTVFSQRSMWRFEASPRRAAPKGLPSSFTQHRIQRGADLHSLKPLLLRSWHTDITYIATGEGWLYLATVIDCCTKEVIGYAMDDHYQTPLISRAIRNAARNRKLAKGAISTLTAEVTTCQPSSGRRSIDWGFADPPDVPESVSTMPWPSRSSAP
ncbi:DDE-type integrase/transposase/recombinase [Streptomyces sp. NPDC006668]|uniref:DDE-type integrase/transposase/recombinase n=1 Tax=Streptomyces sp. NPDC006668 TaxID=3156903 RepID=UPI0033C1F5F0